MTTEKDGMKLLLHFSNNENKYPKNKLNATETRPKQQQQQQHQQQQQQQYQEQIPKR